jgi:hypothetical protein
MGYVATGLMGALSVGSLAQSQEQQDPGMDDDRNFPPEETIRIEIHDKGRFLKYLKQPIITVMLGTVRTPATGGPPNGTLTFPDGKGGQTIRFYDANGRAYKDVDTGHDHGAGDPHVHDWDWSKKPPRQKGRAPNPGEPLKSSDLNAPDPSVSNPGLSDPFPKPPMNTVPIMPINPVMPPMTPIMPIEPMPILVPL